MVGALVDSAKSKEEALGKKNGHAGILPPREGRGTCQREREESGTRCSVARCPGRAVRVDAVLCDSALVAGADAGECAEDVRRGEAGEPGRGDEEERAGGSLPGAAGRVGDVHADRRGAAVPRGEDCPLEPPSVRDHRRHGRGGAGTRPRAKPAARGPQSDRTSDRLQAAPRRRPHPTRRRRSVGSQRPGFGQQCRAAARAARRDQGPRRQRPDRIDGRHQPCASLPASGVRGGFPRLGQEREVGLRRARAAGSAARSRGEVRLQNPLLPGGKTQLRPEAPGRGRPGADRARLVRVQQGRVEQAPRGGEQKGAGQSRQQEEGARSYHDDWKARQEAGNRAAAYTRAVAQGLLEWLVPQLVAFAETQPATAPFCAQYILDKALGMGDLGDADNNTWGDTLVKAAKSTGLKVKWRAPGRATKLGRCARFPRGSSTPWPRRSC